MWRDIDDWFGGLPYEYATPGEIVNHFSDTDFVLLRLRDASTGCNEFLFRSDAAASHQRNGAQAQDRRSPLQRRPRRGSRRR
jgi:2-polyprenyl-6-hydroxyphenyl methylase/3-demethylubiquinone-9 3-methyltransferase